MPYDHLHFGNSCCPGHPKWQYCWAHEHIYPDDRQNCCQHFIPGRWTLSEELQKISRHKEYCGRGSTNISRQITFGLLMGCNPIYIAGLNLDSSKGHATTIKDRSFFTPYHTSSAKSKLWLTEKEKVIIHTSFRILNESAKLMGIKIINLNKELPYEEFEKGDLVI